MFLKFPDKAQEQEFQLASPANRLTQIRLNGVVGIALMLGFIYFDYQFVDAQVLHWPVAIRCFVMAPLAISVLIMSALDTALRNWSLYAVFPLVAIGLCFPAIIVVTKTPISIYYLTMGIIQYQIFSFFMLGLLLPAGIFVSVLAALGFSIAAWIQAPDTLPFVAANLIVTSIVLSLAKWHNEFQERQLFLANKKIIAAEIQRVEADRERISWLENLARFLRHEIKNALMGAKTSLLLLKRHHEIPDDDKYLKRATLSIETMKWHLDKVSDVTSLEKAIVEDEVRLLNLDEVIGDHCGHYRAIYPDQEFVVSMNSGQGLVNADQERIRQLLDKLVSNSVDHCIEGTPIVIRTEKLDNGCICLKVKNWGPPLPGNKDQLFSLFFSSRPAEKRDGNMGLGLHIVKLIAERYGGYVDAQNISQEKAVEFAVAFPVATGAA